MFRDNLSDLTRAVRGQYQGHKVNKFGSSGKVSSPEMHMLNMKAKYGLYSNFLNADQRSM